MAGGGLVARVGGPMIDASRSGGPTPSYVAPSQLSQTSVYQPTQAAPQVSPLVQQMMMQRQMQQQQLMGLPAALMQMQGRLNQPMMRGPMPTYQNPALGYRPDMQSAQARLRNVAPSVAEQRRLQAIEDAQRAAKAVQQPTADTSYYGYSGG